MNTKVKIDKIEEALEFGEYWEQKPKFLKLLVDNYNIFL